MARFVSFESAQLFPVTVADLEPVARDVMQYFESQDYEVSGEQTNTRGWLISIYKGGFFKQIMGLQTALNIELESTNTSTLAKASIGVFGQRTIPITVTASIFWPVLLTQISGLVQQSNLDQEALAVVEQRLITRSRATMTGGAVPAAATATTSPVTAANAPAAQHCTNCGAQLLPSAKFCTSCGTPVASG